MIKKQQFLLDLADLLDKYKCAICSKKEGEEYSSVFFQFSSKGDEVHKNYHTGRLHSSAYEIRGMAERYVTKLEQELIEARKTIQDLKPPEAQAVIIPSELMQGMRKYLNTSLSVHENMDVYNSLNKYIAESGWSWDEVQQAVQSEN